MAFCTSSWERRSNSFRKLLCDLSEKLKASEVGQIEYVRSISTEKPGDALGALTALEKRGDISPNHTEPLVLLLQKVNRHDLAEHVRNTYQVLYPDLERNHSTVEDSDTTTSVGGVDEDNLFPLVNFDRSNVTNRSLPLSKTCRTHARRPSDSAMTISFTLPISPTQSDSQRRLSIHSVVSEGSNNVVSSTSLRLTSETVDSSADTGQTAAESGNTTHATISSTTEYSSSSIPPTTHKKQSVDTSFSATCQTSCDSGVSSWKQMIPWRGRKDGERGQGEKRISKCTWNIKSEGVLPLMDQRGCLTQGIYYPDHVAIDIQYGKANPYLTLCLYPYGLYEDANKSMTLQFKVVIPDACPPIPTKATFEISWEVFSKEEQSFRKLESYRQSIQVKFKIGMGYIHKFLTHSQVPKHNFWSLEIDIRVSTNYSIPNS